MTEPEQEPSIRAVVKKYSEGDIFYVDLYFDESNDPYEGIFDLTKEQADLIASKVNMPNPIEVIEDMERHSKRNNLYLIGYLDALLELKGKLTKEDK